MSIDDYSLFGRIQLQCQSVSNLIQWGEHLSVEHPEIDSQHEAIFNLGTNVYENWRSGGSMAVLRPEVDRLANLLKAHFAYEERLLADICFVGLDEHVAEHRSMLDDMEAIKDRFHLVKNGVEVTGGSLLSPSWPIMQFLLGFTVGHVMSSDMAYYSALSASRAPA